MKDLLEKFDQEEHHAEHLNVGLYASTGNVSSCDYSECSENTYVRGTRDQIKLRKIIHPESHGVVIFNAAVDFLKRDEYLAAFVGFQNARPVPDFMEISIPIRFLYILITSKHEIHLDGYQICRTAATLFKDRVSRYLITCKSWLAKSCLSTSNFLSRFDTITL